MSTEQSATPPMPEPVAPKWTVTLWRDRNGRQWQAKKNGRWYSPYGELFIDGYADALVDSLDELRAAHGPLTPLAVDNVPALLAAESRYRQLWAAQVRDRQAEPRDPVRDAAESALWETFRQMLRQVEAERDEARDRLDEVRMSARDAALASLALAQELADKSDRWAAYEQRVSAQLAAARTTVAEQIAAAIEAKRGPGQSGRYVAALTRAADIARTFAVQSGTGSEPTGDLLREDPNALPANSVRFGPGVYGPPRRVVAAGLPEQNGEVEPPESLPTGGDEIGSPDTWTRAKSSTEEQQ